MRIHAAPLNRADLAMLNGGSHGSTDEMDSPLGLEWAGEIAALGDGVTCRKFGDRISGAGSGAFADYALGYSTRILPVPAALSYAEAATIPVALLTSHDGLASNGARQPGKSVLIEGTSWFAGKVAVVTGGGSGIGRATCLNLAEGGADVVEVSNVAEQAGAVAAEVCTLGVKGIARTVDITDLAAVEALNAEVEKDLGGANIPVTCVGVLGARKLNTEISAAEWHQIIAVNLGGTFYCIKAFLPGMLARDRLRIITLSSASGKLPAALNSDYAASKHGVTGLTKTIAIESKMLGKNGVTANALCPGPIDTPMMEVIIDFFAHGMNRTYEKFHKVAVAKNIQRRLLDPREITSMAAHLVSVEARGIKDQAINVCGGLVLF